MSDRRIAIVGATGAVGRTMLKVLEERNFPLSDLRLLSSPRSAGRRIATLWGEVTVEDLTTVDPTGIDIALFSAGGERSRDYAPRFASSGAVVVDNSSAFRMDPKVPLVVADVNDHALSTHEGIIANPNCTTMTLMMAAAPLHRAAGLRSMVATSYQSVSGTGQKAIDELTRQVAMLGKDSPALISGGWEDPGGDVYVRPIGWNVIPFAGSGNTGGYTDEEWKLVNESRKILELEELKVEPTCVRVPVLVGHGVAATLRFSENLPVSLATEVLGRAPGVQLWTERVPTPLDSVGIDDVLVGRLRETLGEPGGINLWVVGDNLRKGAALNAVQIAERLIG